MGNWTNCITFDAKNTLIVKGSLYHDMLFKWEILLNRKHTKRAEHIYVNHMEKFCH
jgi:hypothetical protein